jgi:cytochrome P450
MSKVSLIPSTISSETLADPYPYWQLLRHESPIHPIKLPGTKSLTYLVTRRKDIKEIALNHELFCNEVPSDIWRWGNLGPELQPLLDECGFPIVHTIATADPPSHTHYRSLLGPLFNPNIIAGIEPKLQIAIDSYLDKIPLGERFNLMSSFAIPIPIAMIADFLGLSESDRPKVQLYTDAFVRMVDPSSSLEVARESVKIFAEGQQLLWRHIEETRKNPTESILSKMIAARDENGKDLSREELLSLCYVFMSAGNETTRNAIALAGYYLAKHPEIWEDLKADQAKLPTFVEEVLRMGTPARVNPRLAKEDTEIAGVPIPKDSVLFLVWASANRDAECFSDPDKIILSRVNPRDHQAFGYGIHRCLGAPLARTELTRSIQSWLERYQSWQFAIPEEKIHEPPLFGFRTFENLPIIVNQ